MQSIKTIFILIIFCFLSMHMVGQTKTALIIGNNDYIEFTNLRFSIEESYELKETLLKMGYEVTLIMNAPRSEMLNAIDVFFSRDASLSLFYFSGHTYRSESSNDVYLVPIDAKVMGRFVSESDLISISRIEQFLSKSNSQQKMLIFDVVDNFELGKIQEEIQLTISDNQDRDSTIVLANNNSQKSPYETSYLLKMFLEELKNPQQTIRGSFEDILRKSYSNSNMNMSLFYERFNPDILWDGNKPTMTGPGIMPSFPFPPPKASASYVLDKEHFQGVDNLYEISEILNNTLKSCGYFERSYYQIPGGFALVTRIEKIELDATPCSVDRWNAPHDESSENFSIRAYFRSLFKAKKGKYRIIVFLVTSIPFSQREQKMSITQAEKYLKSGYNALPEEFKSIPFASDYDCTALIYEFDKVEFEEGVQVENSKYLGHEHLRKNNFLPILIKRKK